MSDEMNKIKVVWVTCFSNQTIRDRASFHIPWYERLIRFLFNKPAINTNTDTCIWNTYAITEFERFKEIELTVITPFFYLDTQEIEFVNNGVNYYVFKDECDNLFRRLKRRLFATYDYSKNTRAIIKKIDEIKPDIIHYIGAENPNYDISALYLSKEYPIIVQLQTLLNQEGFSDNYDISKKDYIYRSSIELAVINRADYVGISANHFRDVLVNQLGLNKHYLNTRLALTEPVNGQESHKVFDFLYFANDISKSFDIALEAFILAKKTYPDITMDVVGNSTPEFKQKINNRINETGLETCITFEGRLPSHEDVMKQIRKSRFAVLPLKVDLISGTIREAMANGIPVVTTITPDTPSLNKDKECVLLSPKGDIESIKRNMIRLIEEPELSKRLKNNAMELALQRPSNYSLMKDWVKEYKLILLSRDGHNSR